MANKNFLPIGWSVGQNRWLDESGVYHLNIVCPDNNFAHRACGYKGRLSGQLDREVAYNKRCQNCVRVAINRFKSIDHWTAEECDHCMSSLNREFVQIEEIQANLEYYREHCRYLFRDNARLCNADLVGVM